MKKQKLYDAITNISDKIVTDAKKYKFKKRFALWVPAVACLVAVVMVLPMFFGKDNTVNTNKTPTVSESPVTDLTELKSGFNQVALAAPTPVDVIEISGLLSDDLNEYIYKSSEALLSDSDDNVIYSPVASYLNLSMLSECAYGDSRKQILDAFGGADVESNRNQASRVLYSLDSSDVASSLWLPGNYRYSEDTLKILSESYCTSVYEGDYASEQMVSALKDWMNEKTDSKVSALVDDFKLSDTSQMILVNTIKSQSRWMYEFKEYATKNAVFKSADGEVTVPFLNKSNYDISYRKCDNFLAFELRYYNGGKMVFMLPDEGVSVSQMIKTEEYAEAITDSVFCTNNGTFDLSLPKFSVTSNVNLVDMAKSLGITDIFDNDLANLSALSSDLDNTSIYNFSQMINITVDEGGVEASGINIGEGGTYGDNSSVTQKIIVDRPFTFMVYSMYGTPVFSGVINNPSK